MTIDFARLKSQLLISGLQQKDNTLFQVINALIDNTQQFQNSVVGTSSSSGGGTGINNQSFVTVNNDQATLHNSRQLTAGTNITLTENSNQITIDSSGAGSNWDVLTDGNIEETELVFALGQVIMCQIPPL